MEHFKEKNNKKEQFKIIFLFFILSVFFCYPYLSNTIIKGHDLEYHLLRINGIAQGLKDGQFPVKIHPQVLNGLGYANSLFYPELFIYMPAFIFSIGVSLITSYKIFIFLITFATMLIMYYCVNRMFNNKYIAILSSIIYTFSSYRITDVYMRTDLGEILSFAFIPIVIYGCYEIYMGSYKKWYMLAIGMTGVIYSHVLAALFCVVIVAVFTIINLIHPCKERKRIKYAFYAAFLTLLLSAAYILPYLEQINDAKFKVSSSFNSDLSSTSITPAKLFMNTYKYGYAPDLKNDMSKSMSLSIGVPLLLSIFLRFFMKIEDKRHKNFIDILLFIAIIALFGTTKLFPWNYFKFLGVIQFPWRLLIVAVPCLSISAGYLLINFSENNQKQMLLIISLIFIVMANIQLDQVIFQAQSVDYIDHKSDDNCIIGEEYLPANTNSRQFLNYIQKVCELDDKNKSFEFSKKGTKVMFNYQESKTNVNIEIPLIYYKGYSAYLYDGNKKIKLPVNKDQNSLTQINTLNNLKGTIVVKYSTTPIQYIGYIVSLITFIIFIYKLIKYKKNLLYLNS